MTLIQIEELWWLSPATVRLLGLRLGERTGWWHCVRCGHHPSRGNRFVSSDTWRWWMMGVGMCPLLGHGPVRGVCSTFDRWMCNRRTGGCLRAQHPRRWLATSIAVMRKKRRRWSLHDGNTLLCSSKLHLVNLVCKFQTERHKNQNSHEKRSFKTKVYDIT